MKTKKQLREAESHWKGVKQNQFVEQQNNHATSTNYPEQYFVSRDGFDSVEEAEIAWKLALGRILRMGSRPSQDGDVEMYEKCKDIIMDASEYLKEKGKL